MTAAAPAQQQVATARENLIVAINFATPREAEALVATLGDSVPGRIISPAGHEGGKSARGGGGDPCGDWRRPVLKRKTPDVPPARRTTLARIE